MDKAATTNAYVDPDADLIAPGDFADTSEDPYEARELAEIEEAERLGDRSRAGESDAEADLRKQLNRQQRTADLTPAAPPTPWRWRAKAGGGMGGVHGQTDADLIRETYGERAGEDGADDFAAGVDDFHEDPATRAQEATSNKWLRENDMALTPEGVAADVQAAAIRAGLTIDQMRGGFSPGKPNAARRALRQRVRLALAPMYEAGRNRQHMAAALGCSRPALHGLMTVQQR